jgi:magnesium chelatase family protein
MTLREALETTKIHSVAGKLKEVGLMNQRPFRVRTIRIKCCIGGGGSYPQPGEISGAQWCFILDELPEFKRDVLGSDASTIRRS